MPNRPDFVAFHKSLASELSAVQDRFRSLVRHWATDGAYKEAVLRATLRRHLPETVFVGSGFVVDATSTSTQIDLLITDRASPTLFKDGDLVIVTPDAVRAVIEVKTKLTRTQLPDALRKLADVAKMCQGRSARQRAWTGLFAYETDEIDHEQVLSEIERAHTFPTAVINAVSLGTTDFFLHWTSDRMRDGPANAGQFWRSYSIQDLAPAYFLGNLLFACSPSNAQSGSYAWFPLQGRGKEQHGKYQIAPGMPTAAAMTPQ